MFRSPPILAVALVILLTFSSPHSWREEGKSIVSSEHCNTSDICNPILHSSLSTNDDILGALSPLTQSSKPQAGTSTIWIYIIDLITSQAAACALPTPDLVALLAPLRRGLGKNYSGRWGLQGLSGCWVLYVIPKAPVTQIVGYYIYLTIYYVPQ